MSRPPEETASEPGGGGAPTEAPAGRAIVTFARSWQALAAVRSLGRRGVEVVCGDEYALTPGAFSRFTVDSFRHPSPQDDPDGFADALEEAVERYRPADGTPYVLLPIHRETYTVARFRRRFEDTIRFALPASHLIETVRDKGRLVELARRHGVPVPATWMPDGRDEAEAIAAEVPLPAFVKLRTGSSGVGIARVETEEELVAAWSDLVERFRPPPGRRPIVQTAAEGNDYCVTALFDHGRERAVMTYRNLRTFPAGGGPGAVRETVDAPAPEALARRLLTALGWHGVAQVDFVWDGDADSAPRLIEINPRLFSGLFQAIASGVDYPWLLFRLAVDGRVEPPGEVELGVRTETPVLGLLATLRDLAEDTVQMEGLEEAWKRGRESAGGSTWEALRAVWDEARAGPRLEDRLERLREILESNRENLGMLLSADDPTAALGLLYPLAVFLRHGRISTELLVDAEGGAPGGSEGDGTGGG